MNFKNIGRSVGNALYRQVGRANGHVQNHRSLPVDILESESAYLVVFDAPGSEPDDIQVRYLSGSVRIRIERFREFRDGYEMRFPGRGMDLDGEAELPADAIVDPDAGTARLTENGTLRIEIPKDESVDVDADADAAAERDDGERTVGDRTENTDAGEIAVDD